MDRLPLIDATAQVHRLSAAGLLFFGGVGLANVGHLPALQLHPGAVTAALISGGPGHRRRRRAGPARHRSSAPQGPLGGLGHTNPTCLSMAASGS